MSTIDLIILGKIMEHPVSAYELVNILETQNLSRWVKISSQGVYRNVTILHEKGYLEGKKVKEGNMPEKTIYSITQKGDDHFNELMKKMSTRLDDFYFNFNAVIANIDKVDKKTGLSYLESIRAKIYEHKGQLNANYEYRKDKLQLCGLAILELYHKIFNRILVDWIDELVEKFRKS